MGTGIKVNKPGVLDYLLSGFAGAATGAQKGIQTRQAGQAQARAQTALEDFQTRQLDIKEDALALDRLQGQQAQGFRMAQLLETRAGRKASEKQAEATRALQKALGLTFPQRKELKELDAELKPGGSFIDKLLDRTTKAVGIQNTQSMINSRDIRDGIAGQAADLAGRRFDLDKSTRTLDAALKVAELEYQPQAAKWIAEQKLAMNRNWGGMSDEDKNFINTGIWVLATALDSDNEQMHRIAQVFTKEMETFWGDRNYDFPKVKFELKRKRVFGFIPRPFAKESVPVVGEPEGELQPGQLGPTQPTTRGAPELGQQPSIFDTGQGDVIQGLMSELGMATPGTNKQVLLSQIPGIISEYKSRGRKKLTTEDKANLKSLGYTDADIKKIQAGL